MALTQRSLTKRLAGGAAVATVIKVAGIGVSFAFLLVMARAMTTQGFGVFAAALSTALIAGPAATVGQHSAVLRFWPSLDEAYGRAVAAHATRRSLKLAGAGAAILVTLGAAMTLLEVRVAAFGQNPQIWTPIGVLAASLCLSEVVVSALRAREATAWALLPRDVLWRGTVIAFIFSFGLLLDPLMAVSLVAGTLLVLTGIQTIRLALLEPALFRFSSTQAPLPLAERVAMRHAQWGFWGNALLGPIQQQSATIIIAFVLGPADAGAFFAASRLANLLSIILVGANQVSSPMLARAWRGDRHDEVRSIVIWTALAAFGAALIGFIVFVFFGPFILSQFDTAYVSAYWALLVLAVGQLVNTACGPNGMLLLMAGEERLLVRIKVVSCVILMISISVLATFFGLVGASLGVLIATTYWNVSALVACSTRLGIGPRTRRGGGDDI